MKSHRLWWAVFLVCTALVLTSLAWMTSAMLRMERAELLARAMASHQESLRLALWRMDSWLAPRIAREAARPYTDYEPLAPQSNVYNRMLEPLEAGEVLTASPLLPFQSDYFRLHFQIDQSGTVTSPQAPTAAQLERLPRDLLPTEQWLANEAVVQQLGSKMDVDTLVSCVTAVEQSMEASDASAGDQVSPAGGTPAPLADAPLKKVTVAPSQQAVGTRSQLELQNQQARTLQEWDKRREAFTKNMRDAGEAVQTQTLFVEESGNKPVEVGPLVPVWLGGDARDEIELMFVRRVRLGGEEVYQGFLCDWPKLREALLGEIQDLFPQAELVPNRAAMAGATHEGERVATSLATLPATLRVPPPEALAMATITPGRITAAIAWIVVLAGVGLTASTLRSSIAFGRKRSQFASAVTHELRTPLTTFKMYTDMLAEDMVPDEAQKREYVRTLQSESDRLARLVENVLSYARLEEGRQTPHGRTMSVAALLDRVTPQLERRAHAAGTEFVVESSVSADTPVHADDDAVGQILLNLVDNACKYGCGTNGSPNAIRLTTSRDDGMLSLTIRDHGPGISASEARHLFQAFRRGTTSESSQPGLGIGLTLSRALARRLGGELRLLREASSGAAFELTIPIANNEERRAV